MKKADEAQRVSRGLWHWQVYEPAVKTDLSCCALIAGGGLFFIDPIPLVEEALEEIVAQAPAAGVIVTNANHERASAKFCARFEVPLYAHPEAGLPRAEAPDIAGIDMRPIPGAAPGEIALHASGVVVVGDALIHLEPFGFDFLPEKYCTDAAAMRAGLGRVLEWEFEVMAFAHGTPIIARARERLRALLGESEWMAAKTR